MYTADPTGAEWRKSSWSNTAGNDCVEVAFLPGRTALRDSKNPDGAVLLVPVSEWDTLRSAIKDARS